MLLHEDKKNILQLLLLCDSLMQLFLMLWGALVTPDAINGVLHVNCYVLILLVIVSLMSKGAVQHFLAEGFFACFLIFLMGQKPFKPEKNVFLTFIRTELDPQQYFIFLCILSAAIVVTYYSYVFFFQNTREKPAVPTVGDRADVARGLLPLIRILFFVTLPCALYMQFKIVAVRSAVSYEQGYLINVDIPALIKVGYYLFSAVTFIYLAARPSKKEVFFILAVLLVLEGGVQMIQGRRALFATTLFFEVWVILRFFDIRKIKFRYYVLCVAGLLLMIILFYFVEQARGGKSMEKRSLFYIMERFLVSNGGSDSVIANTIVSRDRFPRSGVVYLFDSVVNNPITILLTGKGGVGQGEVYLQNINSFSHWLSYLTSPNLYLAGHGMGSCYLAQVYLPFGVAGVFAVSLIVGFVMAWLSRVSFDGRIFVTATACVLIKSLFTLPRDDLFIWFEDMSYLLVGFCVLLPFYFVQRLRSATERKLYEIKS